MPKKPKRGFVTIAFDDGYLDTFKEAISYLDKVGVKSTFAVPYEAIGKRLENRKVVSWRDIKKLIKNKHELASHGLTHANLFKLSKKDKKQAFLEISGSRDKFKRKLGYKPFTFVFPFIKNNRSRKLYLETKKYYGSARATSPLPYFHSVPPDDKYDVIGFAVQKKHKVAYLDKLADHAEKNGLWLIEVFHLVGKTNTVSAHRPKPYRYFTHINDFRKHVDHIKSKKLKVLPIKDILRYGV